MREIDPKLEPFDIAQVRAGDWTVGDVAGTEIPPGGNRGIARELQK
jgi:hypothetical protein